jgi:hypothetical protein
MKSIAVHNTRLCISISLFSLLKNYGKEVWSLPFSSQLLGIIRINGLRFPVAKFWRRKEVGSGKPQKLDLKLALIIFLENICELHKKGKKKYRNLKIK